MSDSLWPHELQHTRLPCPSLSHGICANSRPSSRWCHPTIWSSVIPFSSCIQSFSVSGSFPMSWLFSSGGHSIGPSASASVLSMNIQGWFPLGWTGLISLLSKGLWRVFSSTIFQKHQLFQVQPSLWSNSHQDPFYRWENWSPERFDHLCKPSEEGKGRGLELRCTGIQSQSMSTNHPHPTPWAPLDTNWPLDDFRHFFSVSLIPKRREREKLAAVMLLITRMICLK